MSVAAVPQSLAEIEQLLAIDPAGIEGDFLRTGDAEALPLLQSPDKFRCLDKAFRCSRIKPRVAAAHQFNGQLIASKVDAVHVGDLEFTASRWFECCGDIDDLLVVEIETSHRPVRAGGFRLLFDR